MKKLRTLLIRFENILEYWEVSAFRGAVIEKVGREHLLFNHHLDDNKYYYHYPLVQYKSIQKTPAIFCIGEGVDEIHKLFNKSTWEINLKGNKYDLVIEKLDLGNFTLNVWDKFFNYQLFSWLGLNEKNFKKYQELNGDIEKTGMLEKILIGNILSFAKGVNWEVKQEIKVKIQEIKKIKSSKYKNIHLMAFDLSFDSNVFLPNYIGLGKGASHGYGVITDKKDRK